MDIYTGQFGQNDFGKRIVLVEAEKSSYRGACLAVNGFQRELDQGSWIRLADGSGHELAEAGQLILAEDRLVQLRQTWNRFLSRKRTAQIGSRQDTFHRGIQGKAK